MYKIAVIPGDGTGPEVVAEALKVLNTASSKFGFKYETTDFDFGGDSFRAGIVHGMLVGFDDSTLVRTASAVAALVCMRPPGVLHSPTEHELAGFLADD